MSYQVKLLEPAKLFLDSLDVKFRAKAYRTIGLLQQFGQFLMEPHAKPIRGYKGLHELRVKHGSNICRIFYFYHRNSVYILTSGYVKKRQKLDKSEIEKANTIMKRFLEESHG